MVSTTFSTVQHPHRHVWDFWYHFEADTGLFHLFYLNADPALVATQQHHFATCVGHATTADFVTIDWGDPPRWDVLRPPASHWANTCLWSGDLLRTRDGYLMLFTGRDRRQDDGLTQAIGVAHAQDLASDRWRFFDTQIGPGEGYEPRGIPGDRTIHAWRDPFLLRARAAGQAAGQVYLLLSAKAQGATLGRNGAIARLRVPDSAFAPAMRGEQPWEVLPPLAQPGHCAEMEVPQLYQHPEGATELLFSGWAKDDLSSQTGGAGGLQGLTLPPATWSQTQGDRQSPLRVWLPESSGLYACRIVPELGGEIIGFDSRTGGLRRSGIQTGLRAMDRDFLDLGVLD